MQLVGPQVSMKWDDHEERPHRRARGDGEVRRAARGRWSTCRRCAATASTTCPARPTGIGIKTASALITEYGDLDTQLARAGEIKQDKRRRQTLIDYAEQHPPLAPGLVTLDCEETPLPEPLEDLALVDPDPKVLGDFLEAMEFRSLARRVVEARSGGAPIASPPKAASTEAPKPIDHALYACVKDLAELDAWIARARAAGVVALDAETDAASPAAADLCGVSLAIAPGEACYIPVGQRAAAEGLALESAAELGQIPLAAGLERLKGLLEDPSVLKVAHNAKYEIAVFQRRGIEVAPIEDTMLISYVLGGGLHGHSMDELAQRWLEHQPISFKVGGRDRQGAEELPPHVRAFSAPPPAMRLRGRRHHHPPLPGCCGLAARQGGSAHRLRDAGAADAGGAGGDGAGRHPDRPRSAAAAVQRLLAAHGPV